MLQLPIKKLCLSAPRSRSGVFLVMIASTYDFLSIFYIFTTLYKLQQSLHLSLTSPITSNPYCNVQLTIIKFPIKLKLLTKTISKYNQVQKTYQQSTMQEQRSNITNTFLHFFVGGASGAVATLLVQPIDTLKVQIQVVSEQMGKTITKRTTFMFDVFKNIYKEKGLAILYRGLGSAIWRQIYYASARLGSYTWAVEKLKSQGATIGTKQKIAISAFSGIFGALIGNPFDVALIRQQASVTTGKNAYKSTWNAFSTIVKEQGLLKLWRGIDITMLRVLLINVGQLAGNEIITQLIRPLFKQKSQLLPNISALLASVTTAFLSLPADNIKVKLQKQTPDNLMYRGIYDCFTKTIQRQGFTRLWVGFIIYLIRGMPHSFVLIRTQQFLKRTLLNLE